MPISQETRDELTKRNRQLEFVAEHAPQAFAAIMATVEREHAAAERDLDLRLRKGAAHAEATTKAAIGVLFGR